ncbi:MAG: geranylgeranyl reductase family protein, partial [Pseudomonadota bacterium]
MTESGHFDVVVVGGGPAGATAAHDLARAGHQVMLIERGGRIKPCGGAVPPRRIEDFDIPEHLIVARATSARMVSPAGCEVDMPINGGSVGMVEREHFDEWLRSRACEAGAVRVEGDFQHIDREGDGLPVLVYKTKDEHGRLTERRVRTRLIIGADGARSKVGQQEIGDGEHMKCVFAYHEIIESPRVSEDPSFDGNRCDIFYQGKLSPDFYAWVFPHGGVTSVGVGSAVKGFSLKSAITALRQERGLDNQSTVRTEGAPIPLKPRKKWDNGRDVILAGDAAGCVAP